MKTARNGTHENGPSRNWTPTPNNTGGNVQYIIKNNNHVTVKKISRAIEILFYWIRDIIRKIHFYIFWEEEKKNLEYYVPKFHPI